MAPRIPFADRLSAVRLTGRGIGFVAVGLLGVIAAYASGWPALLAVALFLLGATAAAVVVVVSAPAELDVTRRIDPPVAEQRQRVGVRLSVRGSAGGALQWDEELPRSVAVTGRAEGRLPQLVEGAAATLLEYTVSSRVRGALPIGPLRITRIDPLGLARTQRRVGGVDRLVVLPRIFPVEPPSTVRRTDPDARASSVFGLAGDQRDVVSRTYRSGDAMRSVDWHATAHRGELMVRADVAASTSATGLVLDARSGAWARAAEFEWAVDYAASLVAALDQRGAPARFAGESAVRPALDAHAALLALAVVARTSASPGPADLVRAVAGADVQVVHVITGTGEPSALLRLPPLLHGAVGIVSVVGATAATGEPPPAAPGWRVHAVVPEPREEPAHA